MLICVLFLAKQTASTQQRSLRILRLRIEEARYSAAAIRAVTLARRDTKLLALREGGLLLGVRSNEPYPEQEFFLQPGDPFSSLALYGRGAGRHRSGWPRIWMGPVGRIHQEPCTAFGRPVCRELRHEVFAWPATNTKHLQSDDITIVVVDVEG